MVEATRAIADDPWVAALLAGEWRVDARSRTVEVNPYKKWGGAHWRLVSLAELCPDAVAATDAAREPARTVRAAFGRVVDWLTGPTRAARIVTVDGRVRACGSQEGNALWAACRLGMLAEAAAAGLAATLVARQWPDGGWNCDPRPEARHSSFHETLPPLRGLAAWVAATGDPTARAAADRAADLLLRHGVVFSERTGSPIGRDLAELHWPPYWHYDLLAALRGLAEAGRIADPRAATALDLLAARRSPDGRWKADGAWWRPPRSRGANVEVVAWERSGPNRMVTLLAAEVLRAAGRLEIPPAGPTVA